MYIYKFLIERTTSAYLAKLFDVLVPLSRTNSQNLPEKKNKENYINDLNKIVYNINV